MPRRRNGATHCPTNSEALAFSFCVICSVMDAPIEAMASPRKMLDGTGAVNFRWPR
jgi:hypothetical protein